MKIKIEPPVQPDKPWTWSTREDKGNPKTDLYPVCIINGLGGTAEQVSHVQVELLKLGIPIEKYVARNGAHRFSTIKSSASAIADEIHMLDHRVILVGHSLGAAKALLAAAEIPEQIVGVIIISPPPPFGIAFPSKTGLKMARYPQMAAGIMVSLIEEHNDFLRDGSDASIGPFPGWEALGLLFNRYPRASELPFPVKMIMSQDDKVFPYETMIRTAMYHGLEGDGLEILPTGGHFPHRRPVIAAHVYRKMAGWVREMSSDLHQV